jgi:hypothetical protein
MSSPSRPLGAESMIAVVGEIGDGHVAVVKAPQRGVNRRVIGDVGYSLTRCRRRKAGATGRRRRKPARLIVSIQRQPLFSSCWRTPKGDTAQLRALPAGSGLTATVYQRAASNNRQKTVAARERVRQRGAVPEPATRYAVDVASEPIRVKKIMIWRIADRRRVGQRRRAGEAQGCLLALDGVDGVEVGALHACDDAPGRSSGPPASPPGYPASPSARACRRRRDPPCAPSPGQR